MKTIKNQPFMDRSVNSSRLFPWHGKPNPVDPRPHGMEHRTPPVPAPPEGVSYKNGTPKWMVKIMENPDLKWMIWGENPLFSETLKS